jgi:hypothetical protein
VAEQEFISDETPILFLIKYNIKNVSVGRPLDPSRSGMAREELPRGDQSLAKYFFRSSMPKSPRTRFSLKVGDRAFAIVLAGNVISPSGL